MLGIKVEEYGPTRVGLKLVDEGEDVGELYIDTVLEKVQVLVMRVDEARTGSVEVTVR